MYNEEVYTEYTPVGKKEQRIHEKTHWRLLRYQYHLFFRDDAPRLDDGLTDDSISF